MQALIARASADFSVTRAFRGVYHYSGRGYEPDALGRTLYQIFRGDAAPVFLPYAGDVEAMLHYLLDEHPEGWQSINVIAECDCAEERATRRYRSQELNDRCFCVLEPKVAISRQYEEEATERSFLDVAFAYVLDPYSTMMHVFSGVTEGGRRIDCDFARGDVAVGWTLCECVDLTDSEPDWEAITYGYPETNLYRHYETFHGGLLSDVHPELGSAARCPVGHWFILQNGYRPGDRCLGADPAFGHPKNDPSAPIPLASSRPTLDFCSHVFRLPAERAYGEFC